MLLLKRGDKGEAVKRVQAALVQRGFDIGKSGADGIFGGDTERAVRAFQQQSGLSVDGRVGKDTLGALSLDPNTANVISSGTNQNTGSGNQNTATSANYRVSAAATTVPDSAWDGTWQDSTPTNSIQITQDSEGQVKVFSYQANMTIDADGDTPNVLGKTRLRQVRAQLKSEHTDWDDQKLEREAKEQVEAEANADNKFVDWDKLDETAFKWGGKYLNADQAPYIVVPKQFLTAGHVEKGDLALVRYNNQTAYAVVGDVGPDFNAGEASMRLARALGIDDNPRTGGVDESDQSVEYVILTGSGRENDISRSPHTFDEIQALGQQAFESAKQAGLLD